MEIKGKRALVLGGAGLVGRSTCRLLVEEGVTELVISSLKEEESATFINELRQEMDTRGVRLVPVGGNLFVRQDMKDLSRQDIFNFPDRKDRFIRDVIDPLTPDILQKSWLFQILQNYQPHIVIDCVNTATAVAYQDIFSAATDLYELIHSSPDAGVLGDRTGDLIGTLYIPQLIRHVQILLNGMKSAGTAIYIKVGTSGTGGMGLNIPYTHSEDKPSRMLLAKSAIAGAHTLLLFLMGRTPDGPIIKEVKPTAAIAWKRIAYGPVLVKGKLLPLTDCPPDCAFPLDRELVSQIVTDDRFRLLKENEAPVYLEAPFIDTGENGMFSLGEFEALTEEGQMEFITPEEISRTIIWEIKGRNTGADIVNALDNATMGPTYRAGYLRNRALEKLRELESIHGVDSVAFEMLGPPKLSKLLYETYILKRVMGGFQQILAASDAELSSQMTAWIKEHADYRARILSIGIPILLPDGKSMLRGPIIKVPGGQHPHVLSPALTDQWARDGWIDLRLSNMAVWKKRIQSILSSAEAVPVHDTSSRIVRDQKYWFSPSDGNIHIGKVAAWIFINEEKGERMKA